MNPRQLEELLRQVAVGRLDVPAALAQLRNFPSEDLGDAVLDHHRALRCGHAEVVLAQGKTPAQVLRIAKGILAAGSNLLITRVEDALGKSLKRAHRAGQWHPQGRLFCLQQHAPEPGLGTVLVISAGTSDQSVAEEADRKSVV